MRYAISSWIYPDEPFTEIFGRLTRFGYDAVELVGEPEKLSTKELRPLLDDTNLQVSSVLTWCIWGIAGRDMASPDGKEREAALTYGKRCVDLAKELGAPIVVVLPAPAGRTAPIGQPSDPEDWKKAKETEWKFAVETIQRLAEYARSLEIILALEPINRYESYLVTDLDTALKFLSDVGAPNLKIHLDTFHMNIEETNLPQAIRRAGDLLVNMHVSDSNRQPPGRGHTDFPSLLQALEDIGYRGYLVLEPVPPGSDPLLMVKMPENRPLRDLYAQEAIQYLKGIEK
ncbi:MAG: sugar phosphate isomerase/epimerase [Anaerolineales bacterium]|nr:sugar phosphate isomerase/epimerase [Anaerolineales bacterium]MDW8162189.1 sugar phosphate isomerase/epimerase family protein [Anaerolineales bacterium]